VTSRARRRHGQRGSVLMLMPAAVLIVLLLGAIAVDSAIVYLKQRQAYNVAFDAANDAAGAGFDLDEARTTGELVWDPVRLSALAEDAVAASGVDGLELVSARPDGDAVVVTVAVTVEHLFVQVFGDPARDTVTISARTAAEVRRPSAEP
jgi:Flp pilus assembly protein TadG